MTKIKGLLDARYGLRPQRLQATVTAAPLVAGRSAGYVVATVGGVGGVRVNVSPDLRQPYTVGDTLVVEGTGTAAATEYWASGRIAGGRADSDIYQFPNGGTLGGTTLGTGDFVLGSSLADWSNWWYQFELGRWQIRKGTLMTGAIGDLNGLYGYATSEYGTAFGQYSAGQVNITTDPTNGFRIRSYDTPVFQADTAGVVWALSTFRAGTGDDMVGMTATDGTWRLYAGNATPASAPFRVDKDGNLTATSVTISGAITPGPGSVIDGQYLTAKTVTANALTITAGGANLLLNSSLQTDANADQIADGWALYNNSSETEPFTSNEVRASGGVDNRKFQRVVWGVNNTSTKGICTSNLIAGGGIQGGWTANATYSVSFYAKASISGTATMMLYFSVNPTTTVWLLQPNLTGDWQRYAARITFGAAVSSAADIYISMSPVAVAGAIDIDHVQVERADTPSDWKPYPSELEPGSVTADKIYVTTLSALTANMGSLTAGSIVIGSTDKLWLNDSADGALNIGGSTKASAPFRVTAAGALTATNATIGGSISGATIDIGGADSTSFHVNIGGDIWSGAAAYADGVFKVSSAGALVATSATVTGAINASSGTFTGLVQIGNSTPHLHLDGANGLLESSTFASGVSGWRIASDGSAEFENITARGTIKTAVFAKSLVLAFAGSQVVAKSASTVVTDVTLSGTTFTLIVKLQAGAAPFANGDLIYLKTETLATYATVNAGSASGANWSYTATYKSGSNSGTVVIGETVIDYGGDGGGRVYITADATDAPHILIDTHDMTATPVWTPRVRLGNLNGISGATGYGLWTDNGYFTGAVTANSGSIAGFLTIGASGGIYQGTGTAASPTTGLKFWNDGGVGRIGGYNATVLQWGADTDGKLKVGAGDVTLDADGITFAQGTYDRNKLKFKTGATLIGEYSISVSSNNTDGGVYAMPQDNSRTATIAFGTVHSTGGNAKVVAQSTASSNQIGLVTKYAFVNRGDTNTGNVFAVIDNMAAVQFAVSATGGITGASLRPTADSTTALQLQNAAGAVILNVDTTGKKITTGAGTTFIPNRGGGALINIFLGAEAGNDSVSGDNNTGLGYGALASLTSGLNNFAAGYLTGWQITSGANNFGLGLLSLANLTTGGSNIAIGNYALRFPDSNTDGNVAIGYQAGYGVAANPIFYNTFIGPWAGFSAVGDYNVFIGQEAGYYETGDRKLFLDNAKRADEADGRIKALLYGVFASAPINQLLRVNGVLQDLMTDAATNSATATFNLSHNSTGTPAAGFGTRIQFELHSSTTTNRQSAALTTSWYEATDATRKGDLIAYVTDAGGEREGWRIRGNGSAPAIGFLGAAPAARQTHIADATNAADVITRVNAVIAVLETFGLIATS